MAGVCETEEMLCKEHLKHSTDKSNPLCRDTLRTLYVVQAARWPDMDYPDWCKTILAAGMKLPSVVSALLAGEPCSLFPDAPKPVQDLSGEVVDADFAVLDQTPAVEAVEVEADVPGDATVENHQDELQD